MSAVRAVPWTAWGVSDIGFLRERNEDAFAVDGGLGCYLVADGLGGHRGGEVASRLARDTVLAALVEAGDGAEAGGAADAGAVLAVAMDAANSAIRRAAEADPALLGMATTVSLLWLPPWDGEGRGWVAHAGDSRVYRLGQGGLIQLTDDHNRAGEMVRAGAMTPARAERSLLSHGITRAAGIDAALEADVFALEVADAEAFLLCSDGLSGMVGHGAIEAAMRDHLGDPRTACEALVGAALAAGGRDNVTVVVVCRDADRAAVVGAPKQA